MPIDEVTNHGAIPALEAAMRFSAQRHRVIVHNIANLSTPDFVPMDVSVPAFQSQLQEAVDRRREATGGQHGGLELRETREVGVGPGGRLELRPATPSGNVLFRDRNNRDVERTLQDLVENATMFRVASDLLRSRLAILRVAISERV